MMDTSSDAKAVPQLVKGLHIQIVQPAMALNQAQLQRNRGLDSRLRGLGQAQQQRLKEREQARAS